MFLSFVLLASLKTLLFLSNCDSISANERWYFALMYGALWVLFTVVVFSPGLFLRPRPAFWYFMTLSSALSLVLLFDTWYYRGFQMFLSCYTVQQSDNLQGLGASIASMSRTRDLLYFLDILILFRLFRDQSMRLLHHKVQVKLAQGLIVFAVCSIAIADYLHEIYRENPLFYSCFVQNKTMHNLSPIGFHTWDAYEYLRDNEGSSLSAADSTEIVQYFQAHREADTSSLASALEGKNLLILQIESLEAFVLGQSIDGQVITPRINTLLEQSLSFSNFFEQVGNGTSSDADLMVNTGLYPPRKGCAFFRFGTNTYNSLPHLLAEKGYQSLAIKADKASYYNWKVALSSMGFMQCLDADSFQPHDMFGAMQSDSSVLFQSLEFIRQLPQPYYTFLVTESLHSPFIIPRDKHELGLSPELQSSIIGSYLQTVHYVDKHIGAMIDAMDSLGMLENTVVVLYGDHSALHKYYNDRVQAFQPSQSWWLDPKPRLPLIIYSKGMQARRVDTFGGQVDVFATLCSLLGVDASRVQNASFSKNLLSTKRKACILYDGSCLGDAESVQKESSDLNQALVLSDKIICSSYFGKRRAAPQPGSSQPASNNSAK